MREGGRLVCVAIVCVCPLVGAEARADVWTLWAEGLPSGVSPSIAVSAEREIFYGFLAPQLDGEGTIYRASLDDPQRVFSAMPKYPLPAPQMATSYNNVMTLVINARGEPVVGLSINGNWINTDPLIMTWDRDAEQWLAAAIVPPEAVCSKNIYKAARAPNGDIWAICQWHGAYRSSGDGRTFNYVDVSKAVEASVPGYFPTVANGALDLGALFGIAIAADGMIVIGSESGGVVHSKDDGATWWPLDLDPSNPTSTMARAANMGNVSGIGVTLDGRVIAAGGDANGPYPPAETVGLHIFDLVARTTATATGIPDYYIGGHSVGQIVTLPSGVMFLNTGRDRVDEVTGEPMFGGLVRSTDGIAWQLANDGIDEIFKVANMELWVDGLGRANAHPFAVDGEDLYVVTKTGKIFVQSTGSGGETGDATGDATTDAGASSTTDGGEAGTAEEGSGAIPTTSEASGTGSGGSESTTDGSGMAGGGEGGEGCGCAASGPPAELALVGLVLVGRRRRPRASVA
jgi:MYXO-CTERM domain-containing protein